MNNDHPLPQHTEDDHNQRDSESFRMLGAFLIVLASIVLLATVFQDPGHARVINFIAGLVLVGLGAAMTWWGLTLRRRVQGR
jgi:hypothetical protein